MQIITKEKKNSSWFCKYILLYLCMMHITTVLVILVVLVLPNLKGTGATQEISKLNLYQLDRDVKITGDF